MTWLRMAGLAGLLIGVGLLLGAGRGEAQDKGKDKDKGKEEVLPVLEIMEEIHGDGGLRQKVAKATRAEKLEDAQKPVEEWLKLAAMLGKSSPPRGGEESWKTKSANYEKQVKVIADAVKSEKPQAVRDSLIGLARSCNNCHTAHKKS